MYARLVKLRGRNIIELGKESLVIGRRSDCDIVIANPNVSAHHCRLDRSDEGQWLVTDLGSTNGTWINGGQVTESEVNFGDEIWFSRHCRFRFEMPHRGVLS